MPKKKSNKPTFTFREPTPKELKEMYPDDMAREAVKDAKEKKAERRKKVEKYDFYSFIWWIWKDRALLPI